MIQIGEIIFVLGMHRSGTSAITRLLNILGADTGKQLLPGDNNNEKGFWENRRLIKLHDQILETLGSAWYDFRPNPSEWWLREDVQPFHHKILEVLEQNFSSQVLMLVKDPRISRLLPFWLNLLQDTGGIPKCAIVMRNPLEVARSIERRDQFSLITSLYLWLVYTLESELYSRDLARTVIKYEKTLTDSRSTVDQLTSELNVQWPVNLNKVQEVIDSELDASLRHHTIIDTPSDADDLIQTALNLYQMITSNPLNEIREYLDELRLEVYSEILQFHPFPKTLFETNKALFETKRELRQTKEQSLQGTIRRMKLSVGRALKFK